MQQTVKVKNTKFVRDLNTRALINTDTVSLEDYKSKRNQLVMEKSEINNLNTEITELKSELSEIKDLMRKLLTK
jgi:hypothetical protein